MNRRVSISSKLMSIVLVLSLLVPIFPAAGLAEEDSNPAEIVYDFGNLGFNEQPGEPGSSGNPGDPEGWELIGSPNDSPKLTRQGYGVRMGTNPNYSSMKARSFQVPVPKAGTYQFKFSGYLSGGGGTGELKIDDKVIGQYSFYGETGQHGPILEMDRKMNLSEGNHTLTLTIVSDTPSSPSMYPTQLILQEVESELEEIIVAPAQATLEIQETTELHVSAKMADGSEVDMDEADVDFTSSDPAVLDVDSSGIVRALASGNANVIVEVTFEGVTKQMLVPIEVLSLYREFIYDFRNLGFNEQPGEPGSTGNPGDPEGWELIGSPNDVPRLTRQPYYGVRMGTNPNYASMKERSFQVPVPKAGTYQFKFSGYLSGGGGTGELEINDTAIGQYSFYAETGQHGPILEMDRKMNLSEGNHTLTLTIVSDTPSSPSMYPTQLILQEVEPELDIVTAVASETKLYEDESAQLQVTGALTDGSEANLQHANIQYTSSDAGILDVDEAGLVTALASGYASILVEVTLDGVTKQTEIEFDVMSAPLDRIELAADKTLIMKGQQQFVLAEAYLTDDMLLKLEPAQIAWQSSDETTATINNYGFIQAKNNGTATISASVTIRDQTKEASITIEVIDKEPQPVNISTDHWAVIPEITNAPVIDANLSDSAWQNAPSLQGFYSAYFHEQSDAASEVKVVYDEQNMYMSFAFEDMDEAIENLGVMIRTPDAPGSEYHYLRIPIAQYGMPVTHDWGPGRKTISDYALETSKNGDMIHAEVAISFHALGVDGVQKGDEWGLNVIVQQTPGKASLYSWIPVRSSAFVDDYRDSIEMWADISDEGRMGSFFTGQLPQNGQPWQPEQVVLKYKSYQDKKLTLQSSESLAHVTQNNLSLLWKSPLGTWEELDSVQLLDVGEENNRVTISFEHPQPRAKGTYQLLATLPIDGSNHMQTVILTFDRENLIEAGNRYDDAYGAKVDQASVELVPASAKVDQLRELIPEQTGVHFAGLPDLPELNPNGLFTFDPASPHQLTSEHSNLVYPNEQFPEDQVLTVENKHGELIEYPYYEDEDGKQYFITAHLWYQQREYVLQQLPNLAAEDPLGAARLLYRFAEVYENYVPMNDYMWRNYPVNPTAGPPYPYWGGTWNRWNVYELTRSRLMAQAYEIINQTDAFEALSYEVGEDVKKKIVDDMFEPTIDFTRSYPSRHQNYTSWLGLTDFGRALNNPAYIHQSVERIEAYVAERFLFDGFQNTTSVSYHNPAITGVNMAIDNLAGWTDPTGYVSPLTGLSLENFDMRQNFPAISRSEEIPHMLIYGNGHYFPTQDTWANEYSRTPNYEAGSFLLPASGIARLSRGDGLESSQVFLGFQTKYGHSHRDPLNMTYFAEGQELLPDIGYTHTLYRKWTSSTLGHNTVVVDGADMVISSQSEHGGNIDAFAPFDGDVQVVRASQETAYPQTETYKREPWFISFPDDEGDKGYVLDLFRVSGGDRHEFTLNGDANRDSYFETELALNEYGPYLLPEGTEVIMPEAESDYGSAEGHYYGYIYVQDVESTRVDDGNYHLTLITEENGQEMAKMNIIGVTNAGDNELFLGESPSLRATRLNGTSMDNNIEAQKYTMPKMVLRREGENLHSQFVTALEAYNSGSQARVESVEMLQIDQGSEGDLAVAVTYGDYTDIILSSIDDQQPLVVGDMTLTGKMGIIRLHQGLVQSMNLVGGTLLQKGQMVVTDTGAAEGTITDVRRQVSGDPYDAFVTDATVSPDLAGQHIVVTHSNGKTFGYKIAEILSEGDQTMIRLDGMDPGFTIHADGSSSLLFLPFTTWSGTPTFRIENTAQQTPDQEVSLAMIQQRMDYFESEDAFTSEYVVRTLRLHLISVDHFEKQGATDKVIEHMNSFKVMLDQFKGNGQMTDKAYAVLAQDTDTLIGSFHIE